MDAIEFHHVIVMRNFTNRLRMMLICGLGSNALFVCVASSTCWLLTVFEIFCKPLPEIQSYVTNGFQPMRP